MAEAYPTLRRAAGGHDPEGSFNCRNPDDLKRKFSKLQTERTKAQATYYQCFQRLQQKCAKYGFVCNTQNTNSDSFFQVVSLQMAQCGLPPQNNDDLRVNLVSDMERFPRKQINHVIQSYKQKLMKLVYAEIDLRTFTQHWELYLRCMKDLTTPRMPADEMAVVAMAHYLRKDILIIPSFSFSPTFDVFKVCGPPDKCSPPMLIIGHVCDDLYHYIEQPHGQQPGWVYSSLKQPSAGAQATTSSIPPSIPAPPSSNYPASSVILESLFPYPFGVDFKCRDPTDLTSKFEKPKFERWQSNLTIDHCLALLKEKCRSQGLVCSGQTPQDESCFFHAISEQMAQCGLAPKNVFELRFGVVSDMERQPVKRLPGGLLDLQTLISDPWSTYLQRMKITTNFADEIVVVAMAHYLKKDIVIIPSLEWSPTHTSFLVCGPENECSDPPLIVGHVCDRYYQKIDHNGFPSSGSAGGVQGITEGFRGLGMQSGSGAPASPRGYMP